MTQRLVDLESSNLYLFDLLFRHQVYLEGVKAGMQRFFRKALMGLYDDFAKYVGKTRYDNMDAFSRVELQQFIYLFQQAQTHVFNQYTQQLIELLQQFVGADLKVTKAIYGAVTEKEKSQHVAGVVHQVTGESFAPAAEVWNTAKDEIVPANGLTITQMLHNFGIATTASVANKLRMGYANGESIRDTLAEIVGSQGNGFRDGLFSTFSNQNDSIIGTALQHVSSIAQASVASALYGSYQWVAILDSRTTEICRSRNGNVYIYGQGPLPPAHWNCRSKAVSLTQGNELHEIPRTYFDWLRTQPEAVLANMLGAGVAAKILAGNKSVQDISISDVVIPLTVTQFVGKISSILM
jgi:SPP1 gp7 family putative phage head morphogenesis protein